MKIFISGITGYVGRNLAKHFVHKHDVTGLSRGNKSALHLEKLGVTVIKGDLQSENLTKALLDYDVVIHTAADTDHRNVSKSQYDTNVIGTQRLVDAAKQAGVVKFIHISTESVLLTGEPLFQATENMPYPKCAVGNYSDTKKMAEEIVVNASDSKFHAVVLRPRFIWGRDDTTAIPQIMSAIEKGQFAWINDGNYKTSATHIDNVCAGVDCAIERGQSGQTYFLSDDDDKTFKELISALVQAHNVEVPQRTIPRFVPLLLAKLDNIKRRIWPDANPFPITMQEYATSAVEVTLNIEKAKRELGYKPIVSFQQGVSEIKTANE
ncbi:NAD-dependent epimerase/dehydratase family protein [Pseudoalteromonas spongiae]|uniref:NAD-dependent epimerase/dehydratase family protein n=1 Tax=Pseudoalteromonas spongiae TaxID=298657 RepID=UPI0014873EC1|nr:NAD-dependent epimerase/dehydratase family protein [Pseudoalteromonas spongiae]